MCGSWSSSAGVLQAHSLCLPCGCRSVLLLGVRYVCVQPKVACVALFCVATCLGGIGTSVVAFLGSAWGVGGWVVHSSATAAVPAVCPHSRALRVTQHSCCGHVGGVLCVFSTLYSPHYG